MEILIELVHNNKEFCVLDSRNMVVLSFFFRYYAKGALYKTSLKWEFKYIYHRNNSVVDLWPMFNVR